MLEFRFHALIEPRPNFRVTDGDSTALDRLIKLWWGSSALHCGSICNMIAFVGRAQLPDMHLHRLQGFDFVHNLLHM